MSVGSIAARLQGINLDDVEVFIPMQIDEDIPEAAAAPSEPTLEELLAIDPVKGAEVLLALQGEAALKIHWIPKLPDAALSLIMQIEDAPELNEKRVKKWFNMQNGLVFTSLFTSKSGRWRPLCARLRPEQVVDILTGKLSKLEKKQLVECRHQYLPHMPPNYAVRALKELNMQLSEEDKVLLLSCMQRGVVDKELIDWYNGAVTPKFRPLEHMRAYLAIIRHYPNRLDSNYVAGQHQRMSQEERKAFKAEIQESEQTHFACFFKEPKAAKAEAPAVVRKKAELPLCEQLNRELVDGEFTAPVGAIKRLYAAREQIPLDESKKLWNRVFYNRGWLSDPRVLYILDDLPFFEKLSLKNEYITSAVRILVDAKNWKTAFRWYALLDADAALLLVAILKTLDPKKDAKAFYKMAREYWSPLLELWKREIDAKTTRVEITDVICTILTIGDLEMLLDLFDLTFTDNFRKTYMGDGYLRLTQLAPESKNPEAITRALLFEVTHAHVFEGRDRSFVQKLMLRQIEYSGWTEVTSNCFNQIIKRNFDTNHCTSFMSPGHSGRTFAESANFVCSFCPLQEEGEARWRYTDEVIGWIEMSLRFAKKAENPGPLLDFALQNVRNLVDCHPFTAVPYRVLRSLAEVKPHPHVAALVARAAGRGCLTHAQANGLLTVVKETAPAVDGANIVQALREAQPEHLLQQQKAILAWQESPDSTEFQQIKDALFSVWRAHPQLICNDTLAEGLGEIISPNTQLWQKDDFVTFSQFLALLVDNYNYFVRNHPNGAFAAGKPIIMPPGMSAVRYLRTLADFLSSGVRWKLHMNSNENLFTSQVEAVMQLFHAPFYLSNGRAHPELATEAFNVIINVALLPLSTRDRLVKALLTVFEQNRDVVFFSIFTDLAFGKILAVYEKEPTKDRDLLNRLAELIRDRTNNEALKESCLTLLKNAL